MSYQCFKEGCKNKVQCVCLCMSSETFSCKIHFQKHLKMPNTTHIFDSVLSELLNWTKVGILKFLSNESLKKKKLKNISLAWFKKNKNSITKSLHNLDCDLKEINDLIIKINQVSKEEEEEEVSLLKSIALSPNSDAKKVEKMLPNGSSSNVKLFCRLGQLRIKKVAILNKTNNDLKTEQDFRRTCELYENDSNHWLLRQAYEEYINAYKKLTSLCRVEINSEGINLFKYDIENEEEYVKILENPYEIAVNTPFTIKLPNNELFVQGGEYRTEWTSFIIDKNYRVRKLPPTNYGFFKQGIYFNRNIYCFGWNNLDAYEGNYYFMRFDLDEKRWIKLEAPREKGWYNMIIFNRNILTCLEKKYILLYSIDIDSFSTIDYKNKEKRQWVNRESNIILNSKDRLFVIECYGWIYESEANDEYTWKKISFSGIDINDDYEFYCSYNKGGIYFTLIGNEDNLRRYFKFDLDKKEVIEVACYDDDLALKRLDGRLKVIEDYRENFKLDSDKIKNGYTLYYIFTELKELLKSDPERDDFFQEKGDLYQKIGWNYEAIECYNKIIQFDSQNVDAYVGKGNCLQELGKNIKALECYQAAISLKPFMCRFIYYKGLCLYNLGRAIEALECFNGLIKIENNCHYIYFTKGVCLHELKRNDEAKKCLNRAIDLDSNNMKYFLYRAYLLNDLGEEEKSIKDFNKAYSLMMKNYRNRDGKLIYNCLKLLKRLSKLLRNTLEFNTVSKNLRKSSLKNPELLKEIEGKELIIKTHNSKLIKRAIEYLDLDKFKSIEEIQQINNKISEHRKRVADIANQLYIFLQDNEDSETSSDEEYSEISHDQEHSKHSSNKEYREISNNEIWSVSSSYEKHSKHSSDEDFSEISSN